MPPVFLFNDKLQHVSRMIPNCESTLRKTKWFNALEIVAHSNFARPGDYKTNVDKYLVSHKVTWHDAFGVSSK